MTELDLITRLRLRAQIRRNITTRKSVQEGKPDRISDLLEEAAGRLDYLEDENKSMKTKLYIMTAAYIVTILILFISVAIRAN